MKAVHAVVGRRPWQIPLWALLILPVVCAPVFYGLAMSGRVSPAQRVERQWQWVRNAVSREFSSSRRAQPNARQVTR